jgi:hypothetical protein
MMTTDDKAALILVAVPVIFCLVVLPILDWLFPGVRGSLSFPY